jgi:hypothetical protein
VNVVKEWHLTNEQQKNPLLHGFYAVSIGQAASVIEVEVSRATLAVQRLSLVLLFYVTVA